MVFWKTGIEKGLHHPVFSCVIQLTRACKLLGSIQDASVLGNPRILLVPSCITSVPEPAFSADITGKSARAAPGYMKRCGVDNKRFLC